METHVPAPFLLSAGSGTESLSPPFSLVSSISKAGTAQLREANVFGPAVGMFLKLTLISGTAQGQFVGCCSLTTASQNTPPRTMASQDHREAVVGGDLWRSSTPTSRSSRVSCSRLYRTTSSWG